MDIGELKVRFGADDGELQRKSMRAKTALAGVSQSMANATSSAGKYTAGLVALTSVGLAVMVRKQLSVADALGKTSDALGIQTQKLQALQHVGELNGLTNEEVNKTLARMEKRIGEVARVGGTAKFALQDIGVSVDDLVKLQPDKQFEALSAALAGVENQAVRASISNEIFGRSGLKALKLMEQLKNEGLEPTIQELKNLGVSMTRIDAAKIEAANDSMFRVRQSISGVAQSLAVQLAPILEGISNEFLEMVKEAGGAQQFMKGFVDSTVSGFGWILDAAALVSKAIRAIGDGISFVTSKISGWVKANVQMTQKGDEFFGKLKKEASEFGDSLPSSRLKKWVDDVREKSDQAAQIVAANAEKVNKVGDFKSSFFDDQQKTKAISSSAQKANDLESFRESLRSEEESENASYMARLDQLKTFMANKQLTESESMSARKTIEEQHQAELSEIQNNAYQERARFISSTMQTQVSNIADSLKFITGVAGKEGKKQFEITKIASIATALIKGYESVTSSFAAGAKIGGPPLGFAFAGVAAGAVAAQVQAIKSQQYGGGGSVSASGGGGGAVAGAQPAQQQESRSIHIKGVSSSSFYSGDQINNLISEINGAVKDGAVLVSSELSQ